MLPAFSRRRRRSIVVGQNLNRDYVKISCWIATKGICSDILSGPFSIKGPF